jgi:bacteriocin biosynthesis cyclodehydratase domain-containing protein
MTPRLVPDCLFAAGHERVHVRSNRGAFVLRGKHVASWLEQLAPHLDGRRSIETLTASLPPGRRDAVVRLVGMLADQGVVQEADGELPHNLPGPVLAAAANEIAYIDSSRGSGRHHFGRFRATRLLVLGPAAATTLIADAARKLGMVAVDTGPGDPTAALLQSHDVVVACEGADRAFRMAALNRTCRESGRTLLPVVVVGGVAWIGPVVEPGVAGCWECAWRRLDAREGGGGLGPRPFGPPAAGDRPLVAGPNSSEILAGRTTFELFKLVTGSGTLQVDRGLVRLELGTGLSRRHHFHPHPLCQACGDTTTRTALQLKARWSALSAGDHQDGEELLSLSDDLVDASCGILRSLGEDDLPQLPLRATRALVAGPSADGGEPSVVVEAGETRSAGRAGAVRRALASYGQALWRSQMTHPHGSDGTWAWDLVGDAPAFWRPEPPLGPRRLATAAGSTWAEAITAALVDHCARRLVEAVPGRVWPVIDLEAAGRSDPDIAWASRVATTIGVRAALLDTTTGLGIPSVTATVDGAQVVHAAAPSLARATWLALEAVIARRQLGRGGEAEARVDPGCAGPDASRALARRLWEVGWKALAIPTDQDRAVTAVCPYLVTVALLPIRPRVA